MAERPTPITEGGFERQIMSSDQRHPLHSPTLQDPEQAYYDAVVSCNDTLATTLSLEPLSIATALVAKGIIPENTEAETRNPFYTPLQKASILLAAVRSKVKTSPRSLHEFIKILSRQPWSRDAAEALHASFLRATPTFTGSGESYNDSSIYTDYLKSLYATLCPTQISFVDQWPPSAVEKIFRLTMIASKQEMREKQPLFTEVNFDHDAAAKISVELCDILSQPLIRGKRRIVLIEGAPGSGKSTLSIHIGQQWGEGKLFQAYRIVILVILRDPEVKNATSIIDLLPRRNTRMAEKALEEITNADGQGVLWVLDGWDEISGFLQHNHIIRKLIQPELSTKSPLYKSDVIITSRPISVGGLQQFVSHRVELLGFSPSEQERYFNECLQGDAEAFIDTIKKYPAVARSCYLPLNASIYAHLYRCRADSLPTTQYEIFSSLICNCVLRHCKKHALPEITSIGSLNEIPDVLKESFSKICELAYNGVMENTFTFSLPASFNTLGLLRGIESLNRSGMEYTYSFIHMAIQELLAALHMAVSMSPAEQESKFRKLFLNPRFSAVMQHFAAITQLKISVLNDTIASIVQWYANRRTSEDESFLLVLLNCAFEAQDRNLCELICRDIGSSIVFGNEYTLTPMDCNSIGYFLSQVCVIHNGDFKISIMNNCIIDENGWKILADSFCRSLDPYAFITANLHFKAICNGFVVSDMLAIADASKDTSDEAQQIDESSTEKKSHRSNQIVLHVSKLIKESYAVRVLNLGMVGFTADGCKHLSEAMMENTSVEILHVSLNLLRDEGIELLAPFLEQNMTLKEFYLQGCAITGTGIKYLVKSLKKNTTLEVIDIDTNPWLKNQGLVEIFNFLSYNETTALKKIIVSPDYIHFMCPAIALLDQIRADANLYDILFSGDGRVYCMLSETTDGESADERDTRNNVLSLNDSFSADQHIESLDQLQPTDMQIGIVNGRENHKEYLKALYHKLFPESQASSMIIRPDDLQDIIRKSKLVLIQGMRIQGSGKTTTSVYICQQWASGDLFADYEFVILVQLQDPSVQRANRLADIIPSPNNLAAESLAAEIEASKGQGILWIFDGWNDLPANVREDCNLNALITASQSLSGPLARSAIIVTSRPLSAKDSLIDSIHYRLTLDFSSKQMEKHVVESLSKDRTIANEVMEKIQCISTLAGTHPTPLTANLLANVFKYCQHLPPAITTYNLFLKVILVCISYKSEMIKCNSLEDIPENLKDPLNRICELAYSCLMKGRGTFSLPQNFKSFGLLQSAKCFTRPQVNTVLHKFVHPTVQHILAARCIALQPATEQATILKQLFHQDRDSSLLLYHYATMTKFNLPPVKAAIKELALSCLPKSKGASEEESVSINSMDSEKEKKERLLKLICSLHHVQDPLLCQFVASTLKYNLDFSHVRLSPSTFDSVIFFMESISTKDKLSLKLSGCSLDRKMCENLLTKLFENPSSTKLDLNLCFQIHLNFSSLAKLVQGQVVDSTYFADQIAPPIARCLKEGNFLQQLNLSVNGLSPNGARLLANGLIHNTSLLMLDLNYCSVGDKGAQYIFQALEKNQTLLSLDMQGCRITDVGVRYITQALRANKALGSLDISINSGITVQGLSAVMVCLRSLENTTLQEVYFPLHLKEEITSAYSSINEIRAAKNLISVSFEASDVIAM